MRFSGRDSAVHESIAAHKLAIKRVDRGEVHVTTNADGRVVSQERGGGRGGGGREGEEEEGVALQPQCLTANDPTQTYLDPLRVVIAGNTRQCVTERQATTLSAKFSPHNRNRTCAQLQKLTTAQTAVENKAIGR